MITLGDLWKKQVKKGCMFGAELEVESNTKLPTLTPGTWKTERDPSLRSTFPYEYSTNSPIPFVGVPRAVNFLLSKLNDKAISDPIHDSSTTSWHIHLNAMELTPKQLMTKLFLYWLIEPLIIKHCGTKREQNTFAIQLKDSYFVLSRFNPTYYTDFVTDPRRIIKGGWFSQENRYSSQNMSALAKFGSVEYRAMRGTLDEDEIMMWINILVGIWKDTSVTSPSDALVKYYDLGSADLVQYLGGSSKYTKYWDKQVEEDCEENALALLQVDDSKLFPWDLWEQKISDTYSVRKLEEFEEEAMITYRSPLPRTPPRQSRLSQTYVPEFTMTDPRQTAQTIIQQFADDVRQAR